MTSRSSALLPLAAVGLMLLLGLGFIAPLTHRELPNAQIESNPTGASVFLNGRLVGSTPLTIEGFRRGTYALRLEKTGYQASTREIALAPGNQLSVTLDPWPTGKIVVQVNPLGSEVLLDGQHVGQTPVTLDQVSAGRHVLEVRKTNFEPLSQVLDMEPGTTQTFANVELRDRILAMLEGLVRAEPFRLNALIELGHYQFLSGKIDESVETFAKAMDLAQLPVQLTPPFSPEELEQERRWRAEDIQRLYEEFQKTRNWPGKDTAPFREKLDKATRTLEDKYKTDWSRVYDNTATRIRNREFPRAEELFLNYMAAVPQSPQVPRVLMELFDLRTMMQNGKGAKESANRLLTEFPKEWERLKEASQRGKLAFQQKRLPDPENREIGDLSLRMAQAALATAPTPAEKKLCTELVDELQKILSAK